MAAASNLATKHITDNLELLLSIAMLTPMGHPSKASCIWGAPVLLWGPPGIGKSGRIEQVAEATALMLGTVYLSTHQPEDMSGVLVPDGKGGVSVVCTLPQVNELIAAKRGILLLDELTCARPAMQGAGLAVVYERYVAGKRLPGGIRVLAAANPPEEAAGGWNLAPPMANRFIHFDVGVPNIEDWVSWLLSQGNTQIIPIEHGEEIVKSRWNDVWAKYSGLAAGFMKKHRTNAKDESTLHNLPPEGHASRGRSWPSPRSWVMGLRLLATAECLDQKEHGLELFAAAVGQGLAVMWAEWVAQANLPDPKDTLEKGFKPNKARLDIAMAVYSSAISYALSKQDKDERKKYVILAWKLLATAVESNITDSALASGQALMKAGYSTRQGKGDPDVIAVCRDIIAYFGNSGLSAYTMNK